MRLNCDLSTCNVKVVAVQAGLRFVDSLCLQLLLSQENALAYYTVSSVKDNCSNILHNTILCMLVMYLYSSFNLLTYTVDVMYSYEHGIIRP